MRKLLSIILLCLLTNAANAESGLATPPRWELLQGSPTDNSAFNNVIQVVTQQIINVNNTVVSNIVSTGTNIVGYVDAGYLSAIFDSGNVQSYIGEKTVINPSSCINTSRRKT